MRGIAPHRLHHHHHHHHHPFGSDRYGHSFVRGWTNRLIKENCGRRRGEGGRRFHYQYLAPQYISSSAVASIFILGLLSAAHAFISVCYRFRILFHAAATRFSSVCTHASFILYVICVHVTLTSVDIIHCTVS
jgi:hypothetical protein